MNNQEIRDSLRKTLELAERTIQHYGSVFTEAGKPHPQEQVLLEIQEALKLLGVSKLEGERAKNNLGMKYVYIGCWTYEGPYINNPSDDPKDDPINDKHWRCEDIVTEKLKALGIRNVNAYSYPDGSIFRYLVSDTEHTDLTLILQEAFSGSEAIFKDIDSGNPEIRTSARRRSGDPIYDQLWDKEPEFPHMDWLRDHPEATKAEIQEMRDAHDIWMSVMYLTRRELMEQKL